MMKYLPMVFLAGCCSLCPPKIETVYVPTPCLPPQAVTKPTLTSPTLTDKSTSKEIIEAYVFDVEEYKAYTMELEEALKPYYACRP